MLYRIVPVIARQIFGPVSKLFLKSFLVNFLVTLHKIMLKLHFTIKVASSKVKSIFLKNILTKTFHTEFLTKTAPANQH